MSVDVRTDPKLADDLRTLIRGQVLLRGDPGYEDSRTVWNGMIDRHPGLIARCLGTGDVGACVNFARERGLTVCIKGGGHNVGGLAVEDGALMLDMSAMRGVWVDPGARVARAQAGCLLGDVDRETQLHGLAALLGFVSNTGIAGLTLGGGFGYMSRRFGWTSDTVRSMQVVTAEGRLVNASEKENPDLFWALRGGGGNFGVVTGFEYELFPVGPEIYGGAMAWREKDAPKVLKMYRELSEKAPPELALVAVYRKAPPAPWLQPDVHGQPIVVIAVCHTGDIEAGEKLVAPLKALGGTVGDIVQRRPYVTQQSLLDATQPKGRRYYWKSEYLPGLDPELMEVYAEHSSKVVSPHSAILLFPLGGAVSRLPNDHSAVGNRDAGFVFNVAASWDDAADDQVNLEWTRAAWRDLRKFSTGGTYINFLTEEEGDDRVRSALGANYDRLMDIKSTWDPTNFFRVNKNIKPRG